jgi:hypothetical protein
MSEASDDDLYYEMANLYPRETGLPMTVWINPRGRAQHDVRIKVHTTHGNRMIIANTAVVAVRPTALVANWDGQIGTIELGQRLQPLSPPIPP